MPKPGNSSAIVVGKLLSTEGFTHHVANQIKRYALKNATPRQIKNHKEIKESFSEVMKKLNKPDKMIVGAYIKILTGMSLDTGLRIGLTCYAVDIDKNKEEPKHKD